MNRPGYQTGVDILTANAGVYKHLRFGLVTNNAAVTSQLQLSRVALINAGFNIVKLFAPEHGISALGADGSYQNSGKDETTGLPVISLYGAHLVPNNADMDGIDAVIYDLPDVGCRFNTYHWTLSYILEACAQRSLPLYIADRPNMISGNMELTEGPMLDESTCSSFIGRWNIPVRHGCTIGELALLWNKQRNINADVTVVVLKNWNRSLFYDELGVPFIPTSPAINSFNTALLYPGTGFLEGVNVSEGRGTDRPFSICGAPWINPHELHDLITSFEIQGLATLPFSFRPISGKYALLQCHGLQFYITQKSQFKSVSAGLWLLWALYHLYGNHLQPHLYKSHANPSGKRHLEMLTGIEAVWPLIKSPKDVFKEKMALLTATQRWNQLVTPYLLYPA